MSEMLENTNKLIWCRSLEGFTYLSDRVVVDNNIVTSRGPGTAFDFGLALVEKMQGSAKKEEIMGPMLLK